MIEKHGEIRPGLTPEPEGQEKQGRAEPKGTGRRRLDRFEQDLLRQGADATAEKLRGRSRA